MDIFAKYKQVRSSAQKIRLVVNLVRGKRVLLAKRILSKVNKKAANLVSKVLRSAIANATNNYGLKKEILVISKIFVDSGPVMKRMMPRAKGRADRILKRTSHITIILSDISLRSGE
ncbi:50S ribosomal protein L22 [Buchnera aphidicola (Cinara tujafilina)]|uniref:Large ribosomal subunit protein uL22 n=1 Tax=Buchnera aphidicola (Cinara tujafilina) TaxID=261317 RepID=F7WZV3_9GAMM|nr:50S ribosomal protein L22 [Buchnera aphidicola]AEH39912.1 50S ribosomal protein L22 [Buchnera aphidicola (Cinara tujafilina)]